MTTTDHRTDTSAPRRRARRDRSEGLRSRWAAVGAAVAVTLGAGTLAVTHAAPGDGSPSDFVPIAPCRLADTRPGTNVGPFATPIGPDESRDLMAHGTNGDCTIPTSAVALSVNVTALNATELTFFTMHPADLPRPNAANLNPAPNQPPTPNQANVTLATDGEGDFSLYNSVGTVDYVIDVAGYYVEDTDVAPPVPEPEPAPEPNAVTATQATLPLPSEMEIESMVTEILALEVNTPSAGQIVANSAITINDTEKSTTNCVLSLTSGVLDVGYAQSWQGGSDAITDGAYGQISNTRVFDVDGSAATTTIYLNCVVNGGGTSDGQSPIVTALFVPSS